MTPLSESERELVAEAHWVARSAAVRVCKQLRCPGLVDDLEQAACLGLMTAAKAYKPDRGVKFSSFGSYWAFCYARRHAFALMNPVHGQTDYRLGGGDRVLPKREGLSELEEVTEAEPESEAVFASQARSVLVRRMSKRHPQMANPERAVDLFLRHAFGDETQIALAAEMGCSRQRAQQLFERVSVVFDEWAGVVRREAA